jgi:uncharacterized protein (TIGR04222 family)
MALEFDEPSAELTYAQRLVRENGWRLAYAQRVIEEYKRFVFLAMTAGHVASPSEDVDQAWHLHLTYTRSYWDGMCRGVLGRPLHHAPTKGGAAEQEKFIGLYEQTLASYRQAFGAEPPTDIWPPASQRFGEDLRHVSVNTARNWIIPKPRWSAWTNHLRERLSTPVVALGLIGLPLVGAAWNPLDWNGPDFLALYIGIALTAIVIALVVRVACALANRNAVGQKQAPLDAYEVACLRAGPFRAVQAAFAALVQAGCLRLVDDERKPSSAGGSQRTLIQQGLPLKANAPRLEQALYSAAAVPRDSLKPLMEAAMPEARDIEAELRQRELLQPRTPPLPFVLASLFMAAPLLLGLPKIAVGLQRERPVGFLIAACIATGIAALALLLVRSRLTTAGRRLIGPLEAEHAHNRQLVAAGQATPSPEQLALLVGLFGADVLAAGPMARAQAMMPNSSYAGGGCGGGGCGGAGCGGGGCGGGGCGGCGGG